MGFIRGGLLVIVCILFFIGLLFGNLLFTIHGSLEYKDVKENLGDAITTLAEEQLDENPLIDSENREEIESNCKTQQSYAFDANFSDIDINVDISCASVLQGEKAIIDEFVSETVDQLYYKDYECRFTQCLEDEKNALYFVSEDFRNFLSQKVFVSLIVLAIFFVLIMLLAEHKSNGLIISGITLILASLPFMKLESIAVNLIGGNFSGFASVFLSDSYKIFIINLGLGILLLLIGIVIKVMGIGLKLSEYFNKRKEKEVSEEKVSEIVKEEMKKAKAEEAKRDKIKEKETPKTQTQKPQVTRNQTEKPQPQKQQPSKTPSQKTQPQTKTSKKK